MFSTLREKLHSVQEEITSSLKNLKIDRHGIRRKSSTNNGNGSRQCVTPNLVNYEAGIELLNHYQMYWRDIHKKTENTANAAQESAVLIAILHKQYETQRDKMGQLNSALAIIPKVVHGVQEASDLILNVQCAFDETEEALLILENMIEMQELREKELEHRFQLALYRKRREDELDNLKVKLTNEHFVKIKEYEKRKAAEMKVRQAVFQEAFEKDIEYYKDGSLISRMDKSESTSSPTLEEIELEEDTGKLEEFLADQEEEKEDEAVILSSSDSTTPNTNCLNNNSGTGNG